MTQERPQRGEWQPTHAHRFADAVWEATDDALTTTEAIVLLAFSNHCRKSRKDEAWLAYTRLRQQCKIRSNDTVTRVLRQVVDKGWLVQVAPSRAHKQSAVYRLVIPGETAPVNGVDRTDGRGGSPATAPMGGADVASQSASRRSAATAPMVDQTAPMVDTAAPVNGVDRTDGRHPLSGWNSNGTLRAGATASAGALASATRKDQRQAGSGPHKSPAPTRPATADDLAAKLGVPADDPDGTGPPMSAEEAKAQLRALGIGRRRAETSHWKVGTAPVGEPNPHYDPTALARLLADAHDEAAS